MTRWYKYVIDFSLCSLSVGELIAFIPFQVVEQLFSLLSDCMWEAPIAQAKHSIQIKERVQELKLQVCT